MAAYTDQQIKFIKELKDAGKNWQEITDSYNSFYDDNKTLNAIRKTFKRFDGEDLSDTAMVKNLEKARKLETSNRALKKEQNTLLDHQLSISDILNSLESLKQILKIKEYKVPKIQVSSKKKKMIIEPMVSDVHFGLKTRTYDTSKARSSMRRMTKLILEEKERYSKNYNIDKFNILLNGDLIQSATMHKDSQSACDLTNAQQIAAAIESIFFDFILPIALTGHNVDVIGMSGNHDRERSERFTVNPGSAYYTFTIYKALEMLCRSAKLDKVKFIIPQDAYHIYDIFGSYFLVEHGDAIGKGSLKDLENQINKRTAQSDKIIKGIRVGHFHNDVVANIGRYIVNGSPVSDDHYGNLLGYKSRPCQIINYYVETERDTPYYHSLVVNLE